MDSHIVNSINLIKESGNKFQIAFSGGKDSTALVGLFLLLREKNYDIDFEIVHSNTLMEMPYLDNHVNKIQKFCKQKEIHFEYVTAEMKNRYMYNVLGKGLAIPNYNFRWCTDRLKIQPLKKAVKVGYIFCNGERLGESIRRDTKLKSLGCGGNNECGVEDQKKSFNVLRPIINWTQCQVWDFIAMMDITNVLPDVFNYLSEIYSINSDSSGSMRTGCIGCPLVKKDKSLSAFAATHPIYQPLENVGTIYRELTLSHNRLKRKTNRNNKLQLGCISLSARYIAYQKMLKIENEVKQYEPNFVLIYDDEKLEIENMHKKHIYPRGYSYQDPQVIADILKYESMI
jgi:DNA sulfur modification protein DndC